MPGSPLDPRAEGTNRLIRDGATLTGCAADVVGVLRPMLDRGAPTRLDLGECDDGETMPDAVSPESRALVVAALGPAPVAVDDVILHTGLKSSVVSVILLELDLAGRIERHGNQLVSLLR